MLATQAQYEYNVLLHFVSFHSFIIECFFMKMVSSSINIVVAQQMFVSTYLSCTQNIRLRQWIC
jgi:hypothetical protein